MRSFRSLMVRIRPISALACAFAWDQAGLVHRQLFWYFLHQGRRDSRQADAVRSGKGSSYGHLPWSGGCALRRSLRSRSRRADSRHAVQCRHWGPRRTWRPKQPLRPPCAPSEPSLPVASPWPSQPKAWERSITPHPHIADRHASQDHALQYGRWDGSGEEPSKCGMEPWAPAPCAHARPAALSARCGMSRLQLPWRSIGPGDPEHGPQAVRRNRGASGHLSRPVGRMTFSLRREWQDGTSRRRERHILGVLHGHDHGQVLVADLAGAFHLALHGHA